MPFVKVLIHAVWGTKNRHPFLVDGLRYKVIDHIKTNARAKSIYIDSLNGYFDHLHCLFRLNADMNLSKAINLIKGESSFWINKNNLTKSKFEWADEYYGVSVSESAIPRVRAYIQNQEEHHRKVTFEEEYVELMRRYNLEGHG